MLQKKDLTPDEKEAMEHRKTISRAVQAYISDGLSLESLSYLFNVSFNTIASWFCEAISKGYIANDATCVAVMRKHIAEYEFYHDLESSSLRNMYNTAFSRRDKISSHAIA